MLTSLKSSDKVNILNINIFKYGLEEVINNADQLVSQSKKSYICTINAYLTVQANRDNKLLEVFNDAAIIIPDGMPLVWYSKLLRKPIKERISGYDFFYNFSKIADKKNYSYFFLGGIDDHILEKIKTRLGKDFKNITVKGLICPPVMKVFPDEYDDYIVEVINKVKPDILWVGVSAPKQEKWIYKNIDRLNIKLAFGIGAAFNFYANTVKRAPLWMQRNGLEWLYRIYAEPGRLFKKYLIYNTRFIILVLGDLTKRVFRRSRF